MKGKQIATEGFSKTVYNHISHTQRYSFRPDTTYLQYKRLERTERIEMLRHKIPTGTSLIYRGSEGTGEVLSTMKSKWIGRAAKESKKSPSHHIVGYIRDNDSKFFLSFTPCKETVKPYTVGLSLIPKKGYIFVTALPKVFTTPQKLLLLNVKMFERYDKIMMNSMPLDEARAYQSIIAMTRGNNEITGINGLSIEDDWRSEVNKRMHSVIEVCGPGRILSSVMSSSQPAHVREWINHDFSPELLAMDIIYADTPEEYEEMNEKAVDMGIIKKGERLFTITDAAAVMRSRQLDKWDEMLIAVDTTKVASIPKQIKQGETDALLEYLDEQIKANPSVQPREEEPKSSMDSLD